MWPSVWIIDNLMSISNSVHFEIKQKIKFLVCWACYSHVVKDVSCLSLWPLFPPVVTKSRRQTGHRLKTELFNSLEKKGESKKCWTLTQHVTLRSCRSVCAAQQRAQTHTDILRHSSSCECVHKRASQPSGGVRFNSSDSSEERQWQFKTVWDSTRLKFGPDYKNSVQNQKGNDF